MGVKDAAYGLLRTVDLERVTAFSIGGEPQARAAS